MLTGRLVRFDDLRGYGFIAPDKGGEDVFVHANDFGEDRALVRPGIPVEFEASESERGLKVLTVRIIDRQAYLPQPGVRGAVGSGAPSASGASTGASVSSAGPADDDAMCDVLTPSVMRHEVTELLLNAVPTLNAAQIVQVRDSMVGFGQRHGWVEN
jgi:CspA family cold shock protein